MEQLLGTIESQLSTATKGQLIAKSAELLQLASVANKKPMPSFVSAQVQIFSLKLAKCILDEFKQE